MSTGMEHPVLELERRRCAAMASGDLAEVDALASPGWCMCMRLAWFTGARN